MKKIKMISIVMTLIFTISLLCSKATGVLAANDLTETELFDLKSFHIVEGDANGYLSLDQNITRAEFTKVIARLLKRDAVSQGFDGSINFSDVGKNHWAYHYIALSSSLGYIKGDGMGHFFPEENITFNEAVKILVSVLGYRDEAEKAGGYPGGYIAKGASIQLLKNVSMGGDEKIKRGTAFKLVYNSLDAKRLVNLSYGDNAEIGISDQTLRDILMGDSDEGFSKFTGTVTANYDSWLISPISNIKENEVEIDGVLFDMGATNAAEYLGFEVEVFVGITPDRNRPLIRQIRPTQHNEITEVELNDLNRFDKSGIEYQLYEGSAIKKKSFKNSTVFVYNGRAISDVSALDVMNMRDGNIRMLGNINNGSSEVHTVFINGYESFTVESVNLRDERILLKGDDRFKNLKYINLSEYKYDVKVYLMNADGGKINLDDIGKDDVITVYSSLDGMLLKVYACNKVITGEVNELNTSDLKIAIDGEDYKYEKKVSVDKMIGKTVTVKLNHLGKIAVLELDTDVSDSYGAIVKLKFGKGIGNELMAQVLVPGKVVDDEEEADDEPSSKAVPLIAAQNKEVLVLRFASRVTFDDKQYTDSTVLKDAIISAMSGNYLAVSYKLAADGLVRRIDTLEEHMILQNEKQYNAYEKIFTGSGGAFGLDAGTAAICVPKNAVASDDDYLARIEMNHEQNYAVRAYQYNKDTHCPDIVVFQADMNYTTPGIAIDGKKIGLIERVSSVLSEEDTELKKVTMATPQGISSFIISQDTSSEADFHSLKSGDLILYSLDSKDQLDGFTPLISCSPVPGDSKKPVKPNFMVFSGFTVDAEYKIVSNDLKKWVDTITVSGTGLNETTFGIPKDNPPPVYILDTRNNKVSIGTTYDFLADQKHAVIVQETTGKLLVRAVVIII